jgi:hypothetical protein
MVGYITPSAGGDFAPTPEGQHTMVCTRVIDLGTQVTEFQGETKHSQDLNVNNPVVKVLRGPEVASPDVVSDWATAPSNQAAPF